MKKKILYLYSDTGGGHRAAAHSLISAVEKISGDKYEQDMIDFFAEGSNFLNFFARMYAPVINHATFLWKWLWFGTNNKLGLKVLELTATPFIAKKALRIFKEKSPDVIVSVHPLVNHLTINAIKKIGRKTPFITIGMDPVDLHKAWIHKRGDAIVVATEEAKQICLRAGMPEDKVKLLGFPVKPGFLDVGGKEDIREKLGLKRDLFTVLIMGGGEGAGNIYEIADELNESDVQMQLIVICGRNEKLKNMLESFKYRFPAKIIGFTDEVPMVMEASDMIVTKGGPGAIFEAIAKELPMIITNWLPGQEEGNIRYVKKHDIGVVEKNHKKIAKLIKQIRNSDRFEKMKENIIKIRKSRSVFDIAKLIISYLE